MINKENSSHIDKKLSMKDKIKSKQIMLDIILNGNEHDLPNVEKYKKLHGLFITVISILIGINASSVFMYIIIENQFSFAILKFSSFVTFIAFSIEFILRYIAAPASFTESKKYIARLKYIFSFVGVLDILSIIPFLVPLMHAINNVNFSSDDMHLYILFVITLMLKMARYSKTLKFIFKVFSSVRNELIFGVFIAAIVVLISGTVMYYVERDAQPEAFSSVAEGFWWSVITYTTVGYGDIIPITPFGKILASFIAMIGIGTIALPSGIISSAFIQEMGKRRKGSNKSDKHMISSKKIEIESIPRYKYCPYCGKQAEFNKEKSFCQSCGEKVYR